MEAKLRKQDAKKAASCLGETGSQRGHQTSLLTKGRTKNYVRKPQCARDYWPVCDPLSNVIILVYSTSTCLYDSVCPRYISFHGTTSNNPKLIMVRAVRCLTHGEAVSMRILSAQLVR